MVSSDITMRSRKESIGGLVTWANCWRQASNSERIRVDSTGIGVSSPIEPIASDSVSASTRITSRRSSRDRLNIFW